MRRYLMNIFSAVLFSTLAAACSYCEAAGLDEIVGQYNSATEVQRPQVEGQYRYKQVPVDGMIKDVLGWDEFDERTDRGGQYYKVVTLPKVTSGGVMYDIQIFYKDKASVKPLSKGQVIELEATLLKIVDNIGSYTVWVFGDKLSDEDKAMLELD